MEEAIKSIFRAYKYTNPNLWNFFGHNEMLRDFIRKIHMYIQRLLPYYENNQSHTNNSVFEKDIENYFKNLSIF